MALRLFSFFRALRTYITPLHPLRPPTKWLAVFPTSKSPVPVLLDPPQGASDIYLESAANRLEEGVIITQGAMPIPLTDFAPPHLTWGPDPFSQAIKEHAGTIAVILGVGGVVALVFSTSVGSQLASAMKASVESCIKDVFTSLSAVPGVVRAHPDVVGTNSLDGEPVVRTFTGSQATTSLPSRSYSWWIDCCCGRCHSHFSDKSPIGTKQLSRVSDSEDG